MIKQEFEESGDKYRLLNHINTDYAERMNNEQMREAGKGYIYDEKGHLSGREIARIPVEEAAMLEAMCDIDYLSFTRNNDKKAFRRLLQRYPHWRCCEGGI